MASKDRLPIVTIENANILPGAWRNFAGQEGQFNRAGDRNFNIILPEEVALAMLNDGFNVKKIEPREEGDEMGYRIQIAVSFTHRPPQVWFISGGQRTLLDEDSVGILDYTDIATADVMINPYPWEVNGNTGIKAYLHKIFVTVEQDELDRKYSDTPISQADINRVSFVEE